MLCPFSPFRLFLLRQADIVQRVVPDLMLVPGFVPAAGRRLQFPQRQYQQ
jgi:hypothetical protein